MKIPSIKGVTKALSFSFSSGINLIGRAFRGDNSFFSELSYQDSDAGISINQETALNYTAFWSCVRLLSETLASLPCLLYERLEPRGKKRATDHPLYKILHDEPNPEMDSFSFFETLMYHLAACNGNCYSYIDWNGNLTINSLWIMNPDKTTKTRNDRGEIEYKYQSDNGTITLPAYRVWHVPGFGYDGLKGYTPLTYMRNQIGLGVAAEKMGSKLFSNGLTFGGFLEHPAQMSKEAQQRLKQTLQNEHQGVDKAHRLLILEEGMKYNKNSIPPNDAQWLETRQFQRNEMAAFFRIPPHMIGDLERATFSNIEHQSLEFAMYTMRPWLIRFERSMKRQLLVGNEKDKYFIEFLIDALMRGDAQSRAAFYKEMYYMGSMSPNEIREKENMNPITDSDGNLIPEGDEYMTQQNMMALSQILNQLPQNRRDNTEN